MLTYSLVIKFPTPYGVGSMREDQATAQYCYVNSLRKNNVSKSLNIEELDLKDNDDRANLLEELVPVVLNDEFPNQVVCIGSLINFELCKRLI